MAIVLWRETGFIGVEQMPCLKLNMHSINPENDIATRLHRARVRHGLQALSVATGGCHSEL